MSITEVQYDLRKRGDMTDKQADYLLSLLDQRDIGDAELESQVRGRVVTRTVNKKLASEWITRLKAKPYRDKKQDLQRNEWRPVDVNTFANMGQPSVPGEELWAMGKIDVPTLGDMIVPRGSYALRTPGTNHVNDITFYSVWISDDGERWTVRQYVSDERVKMQRSAQYMVLDRIAEDPSAAASLYGHEIGKCGICSRKLTNDISRERGIGPICADKWGW